ncbi:MAG TPA: hypothetical protein VNJ01_05760 [Bacteriovoracaceae bacterium]|nr:hypothetical protein [Bacteriovoracaceae bacterium]
MLRTLLAVSTVSLLLSTPSHGRGLAKGEKGSVAGRVRIGDPRPGSKKMDQQKLRRVEGVVISVTVDNTDGTSEVFKAIETKTGTYKLLGEAPKEGSKIEVMNPMVSDGYMAIQGYQILTEASPEALSLSEATGQETLLGVRLKFRNGAETPCGPGMLQEKLFTDPGSVASYFKDQSRGAVTFSGSVHPELLEVEGSGSICDFYNWANQAEAILLSRGINPKDFTKVMYFTPPANCGFAGVAEGLPSRRSWLNGNYCSWNGVLVHEMGHNLGFAHAGSPNWTYGDPSDVMGNNGAQTYSPGLNAVNRSRAGWLSDEEIIQGDASGKVYDLTSLSPPYDGAGTPRVLVITDPELFSRVYVSLRSPVGFDSILNTYFFNQISIHRGAPQLSVPTTLLTTVAVGASYQDTSGVRIEHLSLSGNSSRVKVSKSCLRRRPYVYLQEQFSMGAGQTRETEFIIQNLDNSICASTNFTTAITLPEYLGGEIIPVSVTLAPQEIQRFKIRLSTSPEIKSELTLPYSVTISGHETGPVSQQAQVLIDLTPPLTPSDLTATPRYRCPGIDLAWSSPKSADNKWSHFNIYRNKRFYTTSKFTTFTDTKIRKGFYGYRVQAEDDAGNVSDLSEEVRVLIRKQHWIPCEKTPVIELENSKSAN